MVSHKLIVITGAAGTGKTSVSDYLAEKYHIKRVMTHTTRAPRVGEVNGVDYYFETPESFKTKHYIEHVQYSGFEYGSSRESLEKNWKKTPILSIVLDTKGAEKYNAELPEDDLVVLFLSVNNPESLKQRMIDRGDNPKMVENRLKSEEYLRDLQLPEDLKNRAHVIINDDLDDAKKQIDEIVKPIVENTK